MILDPIHPLLCFIGIIFCPILTLSIILLLTGHPLLGLMAFVAALVSESA